MRQASNRDGSGATMRARAWRFAHGSTAASESIAAGARARRREGPPAAEPGEAPLVEDTVVALSRRVLGDPARATERERRVMLELILRTDPLVMSVLRRARTLALPDWRLASGAIYQSVWNALTGRPSGHGLKDADLVYFDGSDLSFEAEDRVIRRAASVLDGLALPVEIRNQARVHLWFPERFGAPYPRLSSTDESLLNYASRTHAVAVRLEADGRLDIVAPFGLADIFAMRVVPNPVLDNAATHAEKAARMAALWPEIEVVPWPPAPAAASPAQRAPVSRDWMELATSPRSELPQ